MTGFMKTTFRARWWLEARAIEHQRRAASAYAALHTQQERLARGPRSSTSAYYRARTLKDMVRVQHAAAYHAAIARECLLAALWLKGGQDQ